LFDMPPPFKQINRKQFSQLLQEFSFQRAINSVHFHHTSSPNHKDFKGHESVVAMFNHHTKKRGFIDIAQHITIAPDGTIFLGRSWNLPPASSEGVNGTKKVGTFMFETAGNFNVGADPFTGPQRETVIAVIALVQMRFGLPPTELHFHREFKNTDCPGSSLNKDVIIQAVSRLHEAPNDLEASSATNRPITDESFDIQEVVRELKQADRVGGALSSDATLDEEDTHGYIPEGRMKMEIPIDKNGLKAPRRNVTRHYRTLLKARESASVSNDGLVGLESPGQGESDLSDSAIKDRLNSTRAELRAIIKEYLGDRAELYEIAEEIVTKGGEALRILRGEDDDKLAERGDILDDLEAIVRTDGSRPSFMVRNSEVDLTTSPTGSWGDWITVSADLLSGALDCVGRIDVPGSSQGFQGTGFLIQEDLIITNRHVLQVTADWQEDGTWVIKPGAAIDFGHEFRARDTLNRRAIRRVLFAGREPIYGSIDHKKLDLAVFELEPAEPVARPTLVLAVDASEDWPQPELTIYTVGYPGNPGPSAAPPTLLEKLFQSTYGHKRLAPGLLIQSQLNVHTWTLAHDATTLGGNSGSVVLVAGREHAAAGLHYGGRWGDPRENWGHVLGRVLDLAGSGSDKTLREIFEDRGVKLVNRINA
jgi:hypothetical protein